jgi:hypothetical protein
MKDEYKLLVFILAEIDNEPLVIAIVSGECGYGASDDQSFF